MPTRRARIARGKFYGMDHERGPRSALMDEDVHCHAQLPPASTMHNYNVSPRQLRPAHAENESCLVHCALQIDEVWAMGGTRAVLGGRSGRCAKASAPLSVLALLLCCVAVAGLVCTRGAAVVGPGSVYPTSLAGNARSGHLASDTPSSGLEASDSSGNAAIEGFRVRIWLLVPRAEFDMGLLLYHPALESFKDGFTALGASVSVVGRRDLGTIKAQLTSSSSLSESHWIVIFSYNAGSSWYPDLHECRKRGARLVVYNTEPGDDEVPHNVAKQVSDLGAAEIWDYSEKNIMKYRQTSSAIARYVPPFYTRSLDYDVDVHNGPVDTGKLTCVLQNRDNRDPQIMEALGEYFKGTLQELQVNPATASRSKMNSIFTGCPIGLNLHADRWHRSVGQMESFRMTFFLSNKMCVLSEGLDMVEMPTWDGLVQMRVWKPDMESRLADLKQLFLLIEELKQDPVKLAECRQKSHELYKERFSSERVFSNAGINITMLSRIGNESLPSVYGVYGGRSSSERSQRV